MSESECKTTAKVRDKDAATTLKAALEIVVDAGLSVLEDPARLARVARLMRELLPAAVAGPNAPPQMTVGEYALHARVSERTVRYYLNAMVEGAQFHYDGRAGSKIIIHVAEADQWRAARRFERATTQSDEEMAVDEVTRRRARTALRRVGRQ